MEKDVAVSTFLRHVNCNCVLENLAVWNYFGTIRHLNDVVTTLFMAAVWRYILHLVNIIAQKYPTETEGLRRQFRMGL